MPHIHRPKVETFDLPGMTNTDPKGFVRRVDEYQLEPFGLYMARAVVGHPELTYLESWLLPDLSLRITDQWWRSGAERDYDFYVDVVDIECGATHWHTVDHYLDLLVRTERGVVVLDSDELLTAVSAGMLDARSAQRAMETTYRTVDGLSRHDYDLASWLREQDIKLSWQRH